MDRLILYDDENYAHEIPVVNGFISRVVSAVFHENHADAWRVAEMLNRHEALRPLLCDLEEYFDSRADAEYLPGRAAPIGNEEMRFLTEIRPIVQLMGDRK